MQAIPFASLIPQLDAVTTINSVACTLGGSCSIVATATAITVGTTTIGSGTDKGLLYDNAGTLGNLATANSGVLVTAAPAFHRLRPRCRPA